MLLAIQDLQGLLEERLCAVQLNGLDDVVQGVEWDAQGTVGLAVVSEGCWAHWVRVTQYDFEIYHQHYKQDGPYRPLSFIIIP